MKSSASLKSSSAYYKRLRLWRTTAKLFIEAPISGWLGKRLAILKFNASLQSSSDYYKQLSLWRTYAKLFIEVPMSGLFG